MLVPSLLFARNDERWRINPFISHTESASVPNVVFIVRRPSCSPIPTTVRFLPFESVKIVWATLYFYIKSKVFCNESVSGVSQRDSIFTQNLHDATRGSYPTMATSKRSDESIFLAKWLADLFIVLQKIFAKSNGERSVGET